jgi:hypothetical protein
MYSYLKFILTGDALRVDDVRPYSSCDELSLLNWQIRQSAILLTDPRVHFSELQARLLQTAINTDVTVFDADRAAVVWIAIQGALVRSIEEFVLSRSHVVAVLKRFEDALRRWRWDDPKKVKKAIRWPIISEREIQDVLWLMLRAVFEDVVDEDVYCNINRHHPTKLLHSNCAPTGSFSANLWVV